MESDFSKDNVSNKYEEEDFCLLVLNWSVQSLLWLCLLINILEFYNHEFSVYWTVATGIVYCVYLIVNTVLCDTFRYLDHLVKHNNLHVYMNKLFATPIIKTFHVENYHYEIDYLSKKNKKRKVVSSKDESQYIYKYWTDVSGLLDVNTNVEKDYMRLRLTYQLDFFDEQTRSDYSNQKESLIAKNTGKDAHISSWESSKFEFYNENILVMLHEKENYLLNPTVYYIITVFGFAELFKLYFKSKGIFQEFKINKICSDIQDLSSFDYTGKYKDKKPGVFINKLSKLSKLLEGDNDLKTPLINV
jgi:hypothetical protein